MRTAFLILLLVPAAAAASPLEIGGVIGGHTFASDAELGVEDRADEPGADAAGLI
nr:hypothetical protein [Deltaproteobacteria bacterium]